jgi:hypothetical protein
VKDVIGSSSRPGKTSSTSVVRAGVLSWNRNGTPSALSWTSISR